VKLQKKTPIIKKTLIMRLNDIFFFHDEFFFCCNYKVNLEAISYLAKQKTNK
jgi:hypothetical protein